MAALGGWENNKQIETCSRYVCAKLPDIARVYRSMYNQIADEPFEGLEAKISHSAPHSAVIKAC